MNMFRKLAAGVVVLMCALGGIQANKVGAAVGGPIPPACDTELITNGSFEAPVLTNPQGWDVVPSGQNGIGWSAEWVDATPLPGKPVIANIELQNGRPAQDGAQYTELDSNYDANPKPLPGDEASVAVFQDIISNVGATYKVVFYTSPVPGWGTADNVTKFSFGDTAAPVLVDTIIEDGTANPGNITVWTKHEYTLVATTAHTRISFADGGVPNSFGAFLDNVSVKEVCGGGGGGGPVTYSITGKVWADTNNNGTLDGAETGLDGWKVFIDADNDGDIDPGETVVVTNPAGEFTFSGLAAGSYTLREYVEPGWDQTYPDSGQQHKHVVNIAAANVVDKNFGNHRPVGGGGSTGGGGAVLILSPTPTPTAGPTPIVAGDSTDNIISNPTPTPVVLGAATELPRTGGGVQYVLYIVVLGGLLIAILTTLGLRKVVR